MNTLWLRLKTWWFRRRHPNAETLGPEAKAVFTAANRAALETHANLIGASHILLGLLRTTPLLQELGVDSQAMERDLLSPKEPGDPEGDNRKKVLEAAIEEARLLGIRVIDGKLLLMGLCRHQGTVAQKVLESHKVSLERARGLGRPKT